VLPPPCALPRGACFARRGLAGALGYLRSRSVGLIFSFFVVGGAGATSNRSEGPGRGFRLPPRS